MNGLYAIDVSTFLNSRRASRMVESPNYTQPIISGILTAWTPMSWTLMGITLVACGGGGGGGGGSGGDGLGILLPIVLETEEQDPLPEQTFSGHTDTGYRFTVTYPGGDDAEPVLRSSDPRFVAVRENGNVWGVYARSGAVLDHENPAHRNIHFELLATVDGRTSRAPITIRIDDRNEDNLEISSDSATAVATTDVATSSSTVIYQAATVALDVNSDRVVWSLRQEDEDLGFAINSNTGAVTYTGTTPLAAGEHTIEVTARIVEDNQATVAPGVQTVDSEEITITVSTPPVITEQVSAGSIDERDVADNADRDVSAIRFTATDGDSSDTINLSKFRIGEDTPSAIDNKFEVYHVSGDTYGIRLKDGQPLDSENSNEAGPITLTVDVEDDPVSGSYSNSVELTVTVTDINDTDLAITSASTASHTLGSTSFSYQATTNPLDVSSADRVVWDLNQAAKDAGFSISDTGEVTHTGTLTAGTHNFTVMASVVAQQGQTQAPVADGTTTTASQQVVLTVQAAPVITTTSSQGAIAERDVADDANQNVADIRFTVTDANPGDTIELDKFRIVPSGTTTQTVADKFEVYLVSGDTYGIRLKDGQTLDSENSDETGPITLTVDVEDSSVSGSYSNSVELTVMVTDVNEVNLEITSVDATSIVAGENFSYQATTNALDVAATDRVAWDLDQAAKDAGFVISNTGLVTHTGTLTEGSHNFTVMASVVAQQGETQAQVADGVTTEDSQEVTLIVSNPASVSGDAHGPVYDPVTTAQIIQTATTGVTASVRAEEIDTLISSSSFSARSWVGGIIFEATGHPEITVNITTIASDQQATYAQDTTTNIVTLRIPDQARTVSEMRDLIQTIIDEYVAGGGSNVLINSPILTAGFTGSESFQLPSVGQTFDYRIPAAGATVLARPPADADITFIAKTLGIEGNDIHIVIDIVSNYAGSGVERVEVNFSENLQVHSIGVRIRQDGATLKEIKDAIDEDGEASALISVDIANGKENDRVTVLNDSYFDGSEVIIGIFDNGGIAVIVGENATTDDVLYDFNATDADGDTVTYEIVTNSNNLFEIDANSGEVSLVQGATLDSTIQTHDITVRASSTSTIPGSIPKEIDATIRFGVLDVSLDAEIEIQENSQKVVLDPASYSVRNIFDDLLAASGDGLLPGFSVAVASRIDENNVALTITQNSIRYPSTHIFLVGPDSQDFEFIQVGTDVHIRTTTAPDFTSPQDEDGDNHYEFSLGFLRTKYQMSDGSLQPSEDLEAFIQNFEVTVLDVV